MHKKAIISVTLETVKETKYNDSEPHNIHTYSKEEVDLVVEGVERALEIYHLGVQRNHELNNPLEAKVREKIQAAITAPAVEMVNSMH